MSDEEYENTSNTSRTSKKGDEAFARAKAGMKQSELNESLKDYINEWRNQRAKEEEELKRLKEKQVKRKEIRSVIETVEESGGGKLRHQLREQLGNPHDHQ